jgi:glycosyltransferase involved in cell wall biosynthesis
MRALLLTDSLHPECDAAVVVSELSRSLKAQGHEAIVAALEIDQGFDDAESLALEPRASELAAFCPERAVDVVVAQAWPWFELLPALDRDVPCIAWEHGDPASERSVEDEDARRHSIAHKLRYVYPFISGVIVSSNFLRAEIGWPRATVVWPGCDHVPDLGPKAVPSEVPPLRSPLRVGTLVRSASRESQPREDELLFRLKAACAAADLSVEWHVMGGRTPADAEPFEAAGVHLHRGAAGNGRVDYLRELDVFVSLSLSETVDLALLEAQALGTAGIAFDAGANPEATPLLVSSLDEIVSLLRAYSRNRLLLAAHGERAYRDVRRRFSWSRAGARLVEIIRGR